LYRRLGRSHSQSGHGVIEKNSQPLPGIKPQTSNHPAHSQFECTYALLNPLLRQVIKSKTVVFTTDSCTIYVKGYETHSCL